MVSGQTQRAAKLLFEDAGIPDTGWLPDLVHRFRAAYPGSKRNTKPERLAPAMEKVLAGLPPAEREDLFQRALAELEVHKASERWEDPAFIPHMASWWNGKYYGHDRAEYRPKAQTKDDRCPECGHGARMHMAGGCYDCINSKPQGVCVDV